MPLVTLGPTTARFPKRGKTFKKPVYRDGLLPWIPINTANGALTAGAFFTVAQVRAMLTEPAAGEQLIPLGPADGVQATCIGRNSAADLINSLFSLLYPHYASDEDEAEPVGYLELFQASHVWTLGATQIGATGIPSGFAATDLFAHQVVPTNAGTEGFVHYSPGSNGLAWVIVPGDQAPFMRVRSQIDTGATHAALMLRRVQGRALNG